MAGGRVIFGLPDGGLMTRKLRFLTALFAFLWRGLVWLFAAQRAEIRYVYELPDR